MELKLLNISRPLHPHGIIIDQKLFSREAHIGQLPLYVKCNNGHTLAYMFMMNELKLTGFFSRQQDLCFSHLPHRLSRLILPSPAFLKLISYSLIDITVLFRLYYPPGKSNGLSEGSGRFLRAALNDGGEESQPAGTDGPVEKPVQCVYDDYISDCNGLLIISIRERVSGVQ